MSHHNKPQPSSPVPTDLWGLAHPIPLPSVPPPDTWPFSPSLADPSGGLLWQHPPWNVSHFLSLFFPFTTDPAVFFQFFTNCQHLPTDDKIHGGRQCGFLWCPVLNTVPGACVLSEQLAKWMDNRYWIHSLLHGSAWSSQHPLST